MLKSETSEARRGRQGSEDGRSVRLGDHSSRQNAAWVASEAAVLHHDAGSLVVLLCVHLRCEPPAEQHQLEVRPAAPSSRPKCVSSASNTGTDARTNKRTNEPKPARPNDRPCPCRALLRTGRNSPDRDSAISGGKNASSARGWMRGALLPSACGVLGVSNAQCRGVCRATRYPMRHGLGTHGIVPRPSCCAV